MLTAKQVAEILNCSYATVLRLIESKQLPAIRLAPDLERSPFRVSVAQLQAYLDGALTHGQEMDHEH